MHIASLLNEPLFPILLGITVVPREIENNGYAIVLGREQGALWSM